MSITNLNGFQAWQKARFVCKEIHSLIISNDRVRDLSLKDQLNRSSASIMDNLAEGLGRNTNNEFAQFLSISLGSLMEVKSQLYRSRDRSYIDEEQLRTLIEALDEINRMVVSLIAKLKGNHPLNPKKRF